MTFFTAESPSVFRVLKTPQTDGNIKSMRRMRNFFFEHISGYVGVLAELF